LSKQEGKQMKVTIERLGHLGDGVATGPVFVPMALPGEVVEGDVVGTNMVAPRILVPSDIRVKPVCSHYKACGGCSLQHAAEPFVAEWKAGIVRSALTYQGLDTDIRKVLTSSSQSRRRAAFAGKRTKNGAMIGLHARGSDTLIQVPNCKLMHPDLMAVIPALEALTVAGASRKGVITLTVTISEGGADVSVSNGKSLEGQMWVELAALAEKFNLARLCWDEEQVAERRPAAQRFGQALVTPPAGAFLQATAEGEAALLEAVREVVGDSKRVLDLFAGCGTFSLPLAENAEVHAVESEGDMLAALDKGWRRAPGLKLMTTETRDLFRRPVLPEELKLYDSVVIDPPRAGAEAQIAELARSGVSTIAAVSCNPVSFARDAKTLTDAGFNLNWVDVVDQFRWSPHVEVVASFTR
jgi:23S rRNA (uracil1939-C5)-methyltransferase